MASVLSTQPTMKFQVFKHCGRTVGQGAVVAGPAGVVTEGEPAHLVQTVDVIVTGMVDVVTPTEVLVTPPDV